MDYCWNPVNTLEISKPTCIKHNRMANHLILDKNEHRLYRTCGDCFKLPEYSASSFIKFFSIEQFAQYLSQIFSKHHNLIIQQDWASNAKIKASSFFDKVITSVIQVIAKQKQQAFNEIDRIYRSEVVYLEETRKKLNHKRNFYNQYCQQIDILKFKIQNLPNQALDKMAQQINLHQKYQQSIKERISQSNRKLQGILQQNQITTFINKQIERYKIKKEERSLYNRVYQYNPPISAQQPGIRSSSSNKYISNCQKNSTSNTFSPRKFPPVNPKRSTPSLDMKNKLLKSTQQIQDRIKYNEEEQNAIKNYNRKIKNPFIYANQ